jgi:hypothetical protein
MGEDEVVSMTSETHLGLKEASEALEGDPRWLLIQRIVESRSFERATQLRKILLYVSRTAIVEPDRVLREYDIACDVLDRRKDFDPANDNIVRSQFTHLRRKLEAYFLEDGKAETLIVKIPKGSYVPIFSPVRATAPVAPVAGWPPTFGAPNQAVAAATLVAHAEVTAARRSWRETVLFIACLGLMAALGWTMMRARTGATAKAEFAKSGNAFVQFLARTDGKVSVVAPDLSLVQIESTGIPDVSLSDYVASDYPQRQIDTVKDPALRTFLTQWSSMRFLSFNESMIASNILLTLHQLGVPAQERFARDVRVSDLNGDNSILIGSAASNPWVGLFESSINFRFVEDRPRQQYYFENIHPAAGEPARYDIHYGNDVNRSKSLGFADVVMTQNEMHTGYVLMFVGSDEEEAESAANFLLGGKLPPEIVSILNRKDLTYFEFFLRGHHLAGQADNTFEVVTVRSR